MRKLTDRLREQAKADADDRDLTSRSDLRRAENTKEERLKRLAQTLVKLKPSQLERLQLDEELLEAVQHARALGDRRAQSRQIGVVRQHLRTQADGARALGERVAALEAGMLPSTRPAPQPAEVDDERLEQWLERFSSEGEPALEEFFASHPEADRQALRQDTRLVARARESGVAGGPAARAEARLRAELQRWL